MMMKTEKWMKMKIKWRMKMAVKVDRSLFENQRDKVRWEHYSLSKNSRRFKWNKNNLKTMTVMMKTITMKVK